MSDELVVIGLNAVGLAAFGIYLAKRSPRFRGFESTTTIVMTLIATLCVSVLARELVRSWMAAPPSNRIASQEFLSEMASEANKSAPMMVDRGTELIGVLGLEGVVIYSYRLVGVDASQLTIADLAVDRPGVIAEACSTPATRDGLLEQGVTLRFSYVDRRRVHIGSFDVALSDCGAP